MAIPGETMIPLRSFIEALLYVQFRVLSNLFSPEVLPMIRVSMARKRNTIGCLFYVALVLLVLVIFLFNRNRVQQVIEKTGFARLFEKKRGTPVEVVVAPPAQSGPGTGDQPGEGSPRKPGSSSEPQAAVPAGRPGSTPAPASLPGSTPAGTAEVVVELVKPSAPAATARSGSSTEAQQSARRKDQEAPAIRTRQARLFFIAVQPDGDIQLKSVIRPVKYTDAPLTSTLEALLAGPTPAEVNQGLMSLVAPEARLRRAQVKDGTAYLDFSEAFRFNSLGKEGLSAQLQQVVYSATEFSTVKRVQILLEGKTAEYLGPEGLFIGQPLSRDSFQR
jgi:spore germination protein GerM